MITATDVLADKRWRLDNVSHLRGLRLEFRHYTPWSESWDHDRCAACSVGFDELGGPGIEYQGYTTRDDYPRGAGYLWICEHCFDDLADELGWTATRLSRAA